MSLINLIMKLYPSPAYTVITEVANATGGGKCRSADAIAVGCWPSRGLTVTGFECKSSRSDWLRELKEPEKSVACQKYCDQWFLVTSTKEIADLSEIPESWGWLAAQNGRLRTMKPGKALSPTPIDRGFLASLLRNKEKKGGLHVHLEAAKREGYQQAFEDGKKSGGMIRSHESQQLRELRERVGKFEQATGLNVEHQWDLPNVSAAVKSIMADGFNETIERLRKYHNDSLKALQTSIDEFNDLAKK